jgi:hypothetical protein
MKSLLFSLLVLGSLSSYAVDPGVGTFAEFKVSSSALNGTYKIEITGYDEETGIFKQKYTTAINGNVTEEEIELPSDEVNSKEQNEQVLQYCESSEIGGKLETLTVPAGTFKACKVGAVAGETYYMGAVPFGMLKIVTADGSKFELTNYEYKN